MINPIIAYQLRFGTVPTLVAHVTVSLKVGPHRRNQLLAGIISPQTKNPLDKKP